MSKWKEYRIGEICTLVNGAAFKSNEFQENGVPVIKIANVKPNKILLNDLKCVSNEVAEKQEKSRVRFGDILLTMTGNRKDGGPDSWVGKTALFREWGHYMLNQRLCIVRANEELVNVEYLAYYLSSWNTQLYFINHSTSSGGQANISASIINDYKVILPDINTQMIIASTLNIIDLKIRNNEQINRNLHDQINALYSEKFEKYIMSSNLPAGWQLTKIGNVAEVKNGFAFKGADFVKDGTVPVIKIKNVKPYKILLNTIEYVKEETVIGKDRFKIKHGDILITLTGNRKDGSPDSWVGKVAVFDIFGDYYLNQRLGIIEPDTSKVSTYYLSEFLSSWAMQKYFIERATSSGGQANISPDLIKKIEFAIPPKSEMDEFDNLVSSYYEAIAKIQDEVNKLETLRDTLLPKLMSGEIDVSGQYI